MHHVEFNPLSPLTPSMQHQDGIACKKTHPAAGQVSCKSFDMWVEHTLFRARYVSLQCSLRTATMSKTTLNPPERQVGPELAASGNARASVLDV